MKYVPVESVFTFSTEEVNVVLELQLEDVVFVDVVSFSRWGDRVAKQRQTGQREVILRVKEDMSTGYSRAGMLTCICWTDLKCFVEKQAEVGKDDPQFLPSIAVLEFPEQVAA